MKNNLRPRDIVTRKAIENAIASVAATGGSTNAVLHLLAIAREAGIPLDIDDFQTISERTPLLVDLKPAGTIRGRGRGQSGRHSGDRETAGRGRLCGWISHHRHRPHFRSGSGRRQGDSGTGSHPRFEQSHQKDRRTGDPARIAGAGWLGNQSDGNRAHRTTRPGASFRFAKKPPWPL